MSAIDLAQAIFETAYKLRASDIHIEKHERDLQVRLRVHGVLVVDQQLQKSLAHRYDALVSCIKVMAKMNIAEKRLPQDGRLTISVADGSALDVRVASCPTIDGERLVLRLLRGDHTTADLEELGLSTNQMRQVLQCLGNPAGLILATGPTGSGKTTTLHALLRHLLCPEKCVLSVEDPVEYRQAYLSQIQAHSAIGLTFAEVLRSFLRQDPDAVLVGEIRDSETAEISLRAALTGHLVLTSVHATGISEVLARLIEMGLPKWLVHSAPTLIITQRLIRTLCSACTENERTRDGAPCPECFATGYSGRIGVYEIASREDIDSFHATNVARQARVADQATLEALFTQAKSLVAQGITDDAEIWRTFGRQ